MEQASKEYFRRYYLANRERYAVQAAARYAANKEKKIAAAKVWAEKNKDKCRSYVRAFRERNPGNDREYYLKNKEALLAKQREYVKNLSPEKKAIADEKRRISEKALREKNIEKYRARDRAYQNAKNAKNPGKNAARAKAYYKAHPEKKKIVYANHSDYRAKNKIKVLLAQIKSRAGRSGIPFDIEESDFPVWPLFCPLLGIPLDYQAKGKISKPNGISIDRKIPKLGYVKGNVMIISWRANKLKNDATLDEIQLLAKNLSIIFMTGE